MAVVEGLQLGGAGGGGGSGSSALSAITQATGANTITSGDNAQTWQWAQTTNSQAVMRFNESAAATGGTSTSGVPNQVLVKIDTLAASTSSPLSVYSRGNHVFSVSPTARQILGTDGSAASPTYSFSSLTNAGMYVHAGDANAIGFAVLGTIKLEVWSNGINVRTAGTPSAPCILLNNAGEGFFQALDVLGIAASSTEVARFTTSALQTSRGSADAVAHAHNFRKSRGTVAAPTVITSGDALATISGYGYVGATNTYLEAARIEFDSTGTIADATTGVGGIVKIMSALAGTDSAVQENVRFYNGSKPLSQWGAITFANLGTPANGSFTYCSDCTIANPCAGSGTGAFAKRLNGVWVCN